MVVVLGNVASPPPPTGRLSEIGRTIGKVPPRVRARFAPLVRRRRQGGLASPLGGEGPAWSGGVPERGRRGRRRRWGRCRL